MIFKKAFIKIMKQEYKELLLRDLCARLPFGICANLPNHHLVSHKYTIYDINIQDGWTTGILDCAGKIRIYSAKVEDIKPYLRPMSSMTEEEKGEYRKVCELDTKILENHPMNGEPFPALYNSQDWLNKKRFAYRTIDDDKDMFELGLAFPAPAGMYDNEQNK